MDNDPRTEPLRTWNALERENTENAIVSSMHEAVSAASEPLDNFATWLLLGTAAIASFFITNADQLLPLISRSGFRMCGLCLVLSCLFGVIGKMYASIVKVGSVTRNAVQKTFAEHIKRYKEEEAKIKAGAEFWGITLETGVRQDRILKQFYSAFPKWIERIILNRLAKNAGNPQIAHIALTRSYLWQSLFTGAQTVLFLLFLIAGLVHATLV